MPASWAHVGAMHVLLDRRDLHAVGEFLTIRDLVPSHGRPVVCCINGEYIGRADWWQPVRSGDVVVFAEVAAGGNTGRLIGQLVVAAAVSAFAGPLAAGAYSAMGGTFVSAYAGYALSALQVGMGLGIGLTPAAGGAVLIPLRNDGQALGSTR
jgi:hypothetical protein